MKNCELARLVHDVLVLPEKKIPEEFTEAVYREDLGDAIHRYTDYSYETVNSALYRGEKLQDIDPELARVFKYKGDYEGTVYRNSFISKDKAEELVKLHKEEAVNDELPYHIIQNNMILSTSKDRDILDVPIGVTTRPGILDEEDILSLHLHIDIFENSKQYDISEFSAYPEEREVWIEPNSTLHIVGASIEDNVVTIKTELAGVETMRGLQEIFKERNLPPMKYNIWKGLMSLGAIAPAIISTRGVDNGQ